MPSSPVPPLIQSAAGVAVEEVVLAVAEERVGAGLAVDQIVAGLTVEEVRCAAVPGAGHRTALCR